MKKELLAGTAIVGAALFMAEPAAAQNEVTHTGKGTQVMLTGSFDFQAGFSDQDQEGFSGQSGSITSGNDRGYAFITNSELRITAAGTTDAGAKWACQVQLEVDANVGTSGGASTKKTISFGTAGGTTVITIAPFDESTIDELSCAFAGSWGRLILGNEDGAEDLMHTSSEHAVDSGSGGASGDWEDWMQGDSVTGRFIQDPTLQRDSSDKTKVTYFTPRIEGFQLGVSYVPDRGAAGQAPTTDDNGDPYNFWGFGADYRQKFGDISVRISGVGAIADDESADKDQTQAWQVGAVFGFPSPIPGIPGEFKVGGSYQDNNTSGTTGSDGDSTGFDVGIGYSQGPILLGVDWMHSEVGTTDSGDHELDVVTVGASYKLGKAVVAYIEGFWVNAETAPGIRATNADDDNEALGLIIGTTVKF